jgi:hypothetical protein
MSNAWCEKGSVKKLEYPCHSIDGEYQVDWYSRGKLLIFNGRDFGEGVASIEASAD